MVHPSGRPPGGNGGPAGIGGNFLDWRWRKSSRRQTGEAVNRQEDDLQEVNRSGKPAGGKPAADAVGIGISID